MRSPVPLTLVAVAAAVVVAGCGGDSAGSSSESSGSKDAAAAPTSETVDIRAFKYEPATITVKVGGSVKWRNVDAAAHTSTADDRSFDTQSLKRGKSSSITMRKAGTFAYHCDFHPFMKAKVVVE